MFAEAGRAQTDPGDPSDPSIEQTSFNVHVIQEFVILWP